MDPAMRLTRLSEVGNGVTLYGLEYPGFHGCLSWCYLIIGPGIVIATQPEDADCGTSVTNIWDEYLFRSLESLAPTQAAGPTARWFEHYHGTKDPELDEVFLTSEGRVDRTFGSKGAAAVAAAFERLTGEPEPDFAATGFEEEMSAVMHARRNRCRRSK